MPFTIKNYHIKGLKHHDTHDGVAYVCKLYQNGKLKASVENSGTGGCTNVMFTSRAEREAFEQDVRAYYAECREPLPPDADESFILLLMEGHDYDRLSKKKSVVRSMTTDDLGIRQVYELGGLLTEAMYPGLLRRYPDSTDIWVSGVGWKPLKTTPSPGEGENGNAPRP